MINIIKKIFNKNNTKKDEKNKEFEDILSHNKQMLKPKKTFEEKLNESEIKYSKKYEKTLNKENDEKINTTNLHEEDYFNKLKEKNEKEERKKAFEENRKKRFKEFHKANKKKGDDFELKVGKYYEEKGYHVNYHGIKKGKKDEGIDLICICDENIVLVQCKNYTKEKSIDHTKIKEFHSNAMIHIEKNGIDKNKVILKYIVPNKKVFDNSAIRIFRDEYYNCRYEII